MALRGTLTHRKTRRLAQMLGIPPTYALGILEALWHVTAEQTPDGAIGKLSDQDIADEMFFDGDADHLIVCLVGAGWLDRCDTYRLTVHDWHDHADQATKRKVARHGNGFVTGDEPCLVMSSQEPDVASSPVPESGVQSPVPESSDPPLPPRGKDFDGVECPPELLVIAQAWQQYRRDSRFKAHKAVTWRKLFAKYADRPRVFSAAVEHTVEHGWQGLVEPKVRLPAQSSLAATRDRIVEEANAQFN